jgi:hypothetical protein
VQRACSARLPGFQEVSPGRRCPMAVDPRIHGFQDGKGDARPASHSASQAIPASQVLRQDRFGAQARQRRLSPGREGKGERRRRRDGDHGTGLESRGQDHQQRLVWPRWVDRRCRPRATTALHIPGGRRKYRPRWSIVVPCGYLQESVHVWHPVVDGL